MKLVSKTVSALSLVCSIMVSGAIAHAGEGVIEPRAVQRIPSVMLTADELASPELYHPRWSWRYSPPPVEMGPPPAGIRRPGEFEQMDSTIIAVLNYGADFMQMWTEMVQAYSQAGFTWIVARGNNRATLEALLSEAGVSEDAYGFLNYPTDTIWIRDYGPEWAVTQDGTRHIVDAYYSGRPLDDMVPALMGAGDWLRSDGEPLEVHAHEHELSGGNIMSDGAGTCFFSDIVYGYEKPAGWSDDDVDQLMMDYLGCEQLIVLNPICLDGTGHIDLYAKLVGPTSILLGRFSPETHFDGSEDAGDSGYCEDSFIDDYQDQEDNLAIIEASTNLDGDAWEVTRIPMPEPYHGGYGWVYRSYLNSELFNDVVLMPSYYDPHGTESADDLLDLEAEAIAAYQSANPDLSVVPIDADHIIPMAGAIHCISHEIPRQAGGGWIPPEVYCGDSVRAGDEECDGDDFGGDDCSAYGGSPVDLLSCNFDCTVDSSACPGDECGNGVVDEGEECDVCAVEQPACADWGLGSGNLGCNLDCTLNPFNCEDATACEALATFNDDVLCCPEQIPDGCDDPAWPWPDDDPMYGCCAADLSETYWCEDGQVEHYECYDSESCGYVAEDNWMDCTEAVSTEPAAPDIDCDVDGDTDADIDADADSDEDGGGEKEGCGCRTVGGSSRGGSLRSLATYLS